MGVTSPLVVPMVDLLHAVLLDGAGAVLLLVLVVLQFIVLPRAERWTFVGPLLLLVLSLGLLAARVFTADHEPAERFLRFTALFLLLLGIGRSSFLLLFRGILLRFH